MLEPGTLWRLVRERTEHALGLGALQSIPTRREVVEQGGVRFLVPVVEALERKRQARVVKTRGGGNPFLPYEDDLFVADASDSHLILLNKFNVVEHHLLIVTRELEEQRSWLTLDDFEAMWRVLKEIEGLAFYNAGRVAGASQRHKHLQVVPVPLGEGPERAPMEPLLLSSGLDETLRTVEGLPFAHALTGVHACSVMKPREASEHTLGLYRAMCGALDIERQSAPYNLLVTRDWMLMVPRSREMFGTISVNALGFAGSILVRTERELELVRRRGPWEVLRQVSTPVEI